MRAVRCSTAPVYHSAPLAPSSSSSSVDQQKIMAQMTAAAAKNYTLNGVPTSLADLGFSDIGLE